ncbi:golgin subfamily A member 6-like protein 6 isoform X1 [Ranitomeya imitator]|uniref:golgin subfamily A member 6-like protein 6 isoform X1 n=1 Tax=Ranitomeya imitator TaxID=111125 RepID=UPI0037E793CB
MSYRSSSHGGSNRIVVGISSRSSEQDLQWLMDFIRRTFRDHVSDVKYLQISNSNRIEWERSVNTCSFVILYHTKRQGRINITDVDGALYDEELEILSETPGRSNVLVVLDDLDNCSDSEKQRILLSQPSLQKFSSAFFLFPEEGKCEEAMKKKADFIKFFGIKAAARDPQPNTTKTKDTSSSFFPQIVSWFSHDNNSKSITQYRPKTPSIGFSSLQPQSRLKISIFSRSAENNYSWLTEWLKTTYRPVEVHAVYISNTSSPFYTELSNCSFAILYHTKKHGRINITDVTDNLYDEELQDLSRTLGKENVIVVIDDLQNTDSFEKIRILNNQPSIGRLARGLFLFNDKKKNGENLEEINQILRKKIPSNENMISDYRQDTAVRKYKDSSVPGRFQDSAHSPDSRVHKEATPSRSQPTEVRRKPENVTDDTTRKGAEDSGPEAKKRNLDPTGPDSSQVAADLGRAIQEANMKWQEYQQLKEKESRDMREEKERIQRENVELKCKNSDLVRKLRESEDNHKQQLESYIKIVEEKDRTIEKFRQDLRDKNSIIAENQDTRWKMEDKMNELKEKLCEKEKLLIEEIRSRNKAEREMEKFRQDLRNKDKITEENRDTIRKMEEKIQQLQNAYHGMETNARQEHAGHESQRYKARSPIPGQEADKTSANQDVKKYEWTEEGPSRDRTQWNTAMSNPGQKETQSPREANEQIPELRRRIQQKDEEIQNLKTQVQIGATLINDLLEASEGGKKKPKS